MTGLDPFSSVSFIRLLIVYGNVGHILMLGVGEKLGISRHCDRGADLKVLKQIISVKSWLCITVIADKGNK